MPSVRVNVGELSGGQRQAVAIARALARGERIFLLDEPTAALGVEQQAKVNPLIGDLRAQGRSIVVISHNLEHVFEVADRVDRLAPRQARGHTPKDADNEGRGSVADYGRNQRRCRRITRRKAANELSR